MTETTDPGIENLKKIISATTGIGNKADSVFSDGVQATDFFAFIGDLSTVPAILKEKEAIKTEAKALTPEKRAQLSDYFAKQLDIANDRAEEIIEGTINFLMHAWEYYDLIRNKQAA